MSSKDSNALETIEAGLSMMVAGLRRLRASDDWVDQHHSPLGKKRHLSSVRSGALPGHKLGHLVLVRREDLDRYISTHRVDPKHAPATPDADEADDLAEALTYTAPKRRSKGKAA